MGVPVISVNHKSQRDAFTTLCLLLIVIAFVPYGKVGLTYDSLDFIAASESLHTYLHKKNPDGFSYLTRAPFLPAYLHFFNDKVMAAWWLNMLCLTGSIFLIFKIARALNLHEFLIYPLVIVTTLTYPWVQNHFFLWGEPPFTFLILALTYCIAENKSLWVILMLCVLLFFVRKAGIFFFVSVGAWYFFSHDHRKWLITFVTAVVLFVSWQVLEHHLDSTSTFLSMIGINDETLRRTYYVEAITSWFLPMKIPLFLRALLVILMIATTVYLNLAATRNFLAKKKNQLMLVVSFSYMICLIGFSGASGYMDAERYLNVVLPLWMILLASFAFEIHASKGTCSALFLVALTVWLMYPIGRTISHLL